jgi:hypothetical protein
MTKEEALELIETAPQSKTKMSKPFSALTEFQAVKMIRDWLEKLPLGRKLSGIFVKRVWQVAKNQRRPRYEK